MISLGIGGMSVKQAKGMKKKIIFILLAINLVAFVGATYAFWASSIAGDTGQTNSNVAVGNWGTPIFTPQEFFDFATKTNSLITDEYYLANDIDFTGFNWVYNTVFQNAIFRGTLNGNNKILANLTITNDLAGTLHLGIFPRIAGGRIFNLTLEGVHLETDFNNTSVRAGLLAGTANGGTVEISNVRVSNSTIIGSRQGVGGLIGLSTGATTIVNIDNVKMNNLKIFSTAAGIGGIVGRVSTGATVNLTDIDLQGDIFTTNVTANGGGLVGHVRLATFVTINRAIVEATFQNTFVTSTNYLDYNGRHFGGFIGYNQTQSVNLNITNAFFTGSLYTQTNSRRNRVGTVVGRVSNTATINNVFHSQVAYRDASGGIVFTTTSQFGQMSPFVSQTNMPTNSWWNNFATSFLPADLAWTQEAATRRLVLTI